MINNQHWPIWSCKFISPGFACWSDEDFVGRICRVVRRLNAGNLITWRCITRCLAKYKRYFNTRLKHWVPWPVSLGCSQLWKCTKWKSSCCDGMWHGLGRVCGDPKAIRAFFNQTYVFYQTSENHMAGAEKSRYRNLCIIGGSWYVQCIYICAVFIRSPSL